MTHTPTRGKPLLIALAIMACFSASGASAQATKAEQHARMIDLQGQIEARKGQPDAAALQAEFNQISASLGGDVPCAIGPVAAGSSASRTPAPSPTGCTAVTTTFTQSTPVVIPTGPGVVTSTIVVAGAGAYLWDVDATTFITHSFAADLDVTITSPAGTVVTLTTDNGAGNDDVFNGTVWDDDANPGGAVPYTNNNGVVTDQTYANLTLASPLVPEESFAAFVGENPNGTWTITISDDLTGDGGNLASWSLGLTTFAAAPIQSALQAFNQTTPVPIADVALTTSTLVVAGLPAPVCKAVLRTNISHTFSADMDITLTSPAGTVVTVTTDNGAGNDNVFAGTTWDDDANPAGQVPYTTNNGLVTDQTYANLTVATPLVVEESMGALMGENGNGTWTLTVSDDLTGDTGTITSWGLDFITCTCAVPADVAVTLTDTPDPVNAGSNLSYDALVTNNGPSAATNMSVSLPVPTGVSLVSASATGGGACVGTGPVVCTWAGATASGASQTATMIVSVPANTVAGTIISASATASATETDPTPGNNTAAATTTVAVSADLSITLTDAPDPVTAGGGNLTYTATVSNAGPSDATGVTVTLPLPIGTSLVSGTVSGGGTCAGAPVVCSVTGSIAPAAARTVTIVVAVTPAVVTGTVLTATATVAAASPDPNAANNMATTTTTVITSADLLLGFTASAAQVLVNVPVTFTATSLNQGPSDAQNVVITVTLTPDFRFSSFTAAGATCTTPQVGTTGAIVCTWAGATAPGVTRTLVVVAYSNVEGATAVNASTSSATPDPVANNNLSSQTVQVGYLVEEITTLSSYGLMLLGLLLGMAGMVAVRRQA